jgi:carboxyl-terminal processing protease
MRINSILFRALFFFPLFINCYHSDSQNSAYYNQAYNIVKTAEKFHYNPRPVDDKFADLVFNGFIDALDPYAMYFTAADRKKMEGLKHGIDNEILSQNGTFIHLVLSVYTEKLLFVDSLINTFGNRQFNFTISDSIVFKKDDICKNRTELIQKWEKLTKMQILVGTFAGDTAKGHYEKPSQEKLNEYKEKAVNRQKCRIRSKLSQKEGLEEFVGTGFLKAVASAFDPHTEYFSVNEEKAFNEMLSKESKSFGLYFNNNDLGEIEIVMIVPGGPAWNSNVINEGDVILSVKNNNITKDFGCINYDEAYMFLSSDEMITAEFFVRKKNGKEISIELAKEEINVQENAIKSFLLHGTEKIAYIYLPSFYTQAATTGTIQKGCADDMAKEIIKLKSEGISGLILDLRDNGGGSMMEAILLAGLFIDFGPVSIVQMRDEAPFTLKDSNRGVIWSGPMVVMINHFSASASELFAAAMQDLNRAVIVGSNSFGKATTQEIIPTDAYKYGSIENYTGDPVAFLKLTRGAFYGVNGESRQKRGVLPDILLPELNDRIIPGESIYESALDPGIIEKKTYYNALAPLPILQLNQQTQNRLNADSAYSKVRELNRLLFNENNSYTVPLNIDAFFEFYSKAVNYEIPVGKAPFSVQKPGYMKTLSSIENSNKFSEENRLKEIPEDIYIKETYKILIDLINYNKNK